ncbi:hypothetical protein RR48_02619 [Papilio machaon]|uniref:Uncharacterized protein n=1 Tax=Papilio machaon TaxID=76193 RepID=A0A0N1IFF1_PAPMA|nr:hypothetical protein RR48_02619 [Papilio machaon]
MLVRGCAGGELRHSLAERTKALAARYHALCSPAREESRSVDRSRTRHRKSQTRWYVKVSGDLGLNHLRRTVGFLE